MVEHSPKTLASEQKVTTTTGQLAPSLGVPLKYRTMAPEVAVPLSSLLCLLKREAKRNPMSKKVDYGHRRGLGGGWVGRGGV